MSVFSKLRVPAKLALLLTGVSLLPVIAIYSLLYMHVGDFESSYGDTLENAAEETISMIDRNLFERYGDVQAFGLNVAAHNPDNWRNFEPENPLINAINQYVKLYGLYAFSMLVDLKGDPLAFNTMDAKGATLPTAEIAKQNFANSEWFKKVKAHEYLEGSNGFTGTVVLGPITTTELNSVFKKPQRVMIFAAPVYDQAGVQIGVWVNYANFSLVTDIMKKSYDNLKGDDKAASQIELIAANGEVIDLVSGNPQDRNLIGENLHERHDPAIARAQKEKDTGNFITDNIFDATGEKQFVGYDYTQGAYDYPGLGWTVIIRDEVSEAIGVLDDIKTILFSMFFACIAGTLIIGQIVGRIATKPLVRSVSEIDELSHNNLDVEIHGLERADEFGDLARAEEVLKDKLQKVRQLEAEQKALEIRAAEDKRTAMHTMANQFEGSVGQIVSMLSSAATELNASAENLTALADETSRQAKVVASGTEEASASVQTVAASAEELTASIAEINRQVTEQTQITAAAVEEAHRTDETVAGLADAAKQIGEVVNLIRDIADQTNLLALNATIEAARAGEAGKGFAVVASEVKSLANQTAHATEEIYKQVTTIQGVSQNAILAIRQISQTIERVSQISTSIATSVDQQSAATREIAGSVQQAAAGTAEVSQTIIGVTQATGESREASGQVLDAARELSTQAEQLRGEVGNFLNTIRKG